MPRVPWLPARAAGSSTRRAASARAAFRASYWCASKADGATANHNSRGDVAYAVSSALHNVATEPTTSTTRRPDRSDTRPVSGAPTSDSALRRDVRNPRHSTSHPSSCRFVVE